MKKTTVLCFVAMLGVSTLSAAEIASGSGFVQCRERGQATQKTSFKIDADQTRIVVTVECTDSDPAKLHASKANSLWDSDHVELFLTPDGNVQNFYQFMIPYKWPERFNAYFAEKGNIQPDPYDPDWTGTAEDTETGWRATFTIPLSAFYMTRSAVWKTTWLVNVTRNSKIHGEDDTWAKLPRSYHDPANFNKVAGFPKRSSADDVFIESVSAEITGRDGADYVGRLQVGATALNGRTFAFRSPNAGSTNVFVNPIRRPFSVPCRFSKLARNRTELVLDDGKNVYRRYYPVMVAYEPLKVRLTTPEYRDNFYPGQDTTRIAGEITSLERGEIVLTLEGDGIARQEKKLEFQAGVGERTDQFHSSTSTHHFNFSVPEFKKGEMKLTAVCGKAKVTKRIRKIEPNGHRMAWIEKGTLMLDGKPLYVCGVAATGYKGGAAFAKRFFNDETLGWDRNFNRGARLEPSRLVPGIETREATKDVKPSQELFDAIDRVMDSCKNNDFAWWYVCDEPEMRGVSEVYLRHIYEYVREKDPYHVVRLCSRSAAKFVDCADWFECHPYLDPYFDGDGNRHYQIPMNKFGDFVSCITDLKRPDKVMGTVPTCFSYKFNNPSSDYPTLDEYWCSTWASAMRGAKSTDPFFYADMGDRPWLYFGTAYLFHTYHALSDLLLFGERTTLAKTLEHEAALYSLPNGEKLVIVVNFNRADQKVALKLPGDFFEFRGPRTWSGDATLDMKPFEVILATTKKRDAGLESQADFRKRMDALEYERTHRDNQLFGRERAVQLNSCSPMTVLFNTGYKLFDGVRDVYAWSTQKAKDRYLEMTFTDRAVVFNKMRLYGNGLKGLKIKVRKLRTWVELKGTLAQPNEFEYDYDFGEDIRTVKIRFEFAEPAEFYEIELPKTPASEAMQGASGVPEATAADVGWKMPADQYLVDTTQKPVRYVPCEADPAHPWLEFRLDAIRSRMNPKWNYHSWEVKYDGRLAGDVSELGAGLCTAYRPVAKAQKRSVMFVGYNEDLQFGFLQFVKEPRNRLRAWSPAGKKTLAKGDVLKVELVLDAPCEDVNCILTTFGRRAKPTLINGKGAIDLNPLDETMRRWGAELTVESATAAKPDEIRLQCSILGGAIACPLTTPIEPGFEVQ